MVKSVALPTEGRPRDRVEAGNNPTFAVAGVPQRCTDLLVSTRGVGTCQAWAPIIGQLIHVERHHLIRPLLSFLHGDWHSHQFQDVVHIRCVNGLPSTLVALLPAL
jgi:hypothetical protein